MKSRKLSSMFVIILMLSLTACSSQATKSSDSKESADSSTKAETSASNDSSTDTNVSYPITIKHAFGETVIENKPKNAVTISWEIKMFL